MNQLIENFIETCVEIYSVRELKARLYQGKADSIDCTVWRISADEWRAAISKALSIKIGLTY